MTNRDEQMKAVARLVSGRPDWIDAPAVQAWHRSDRRTEHDGTPGKPRIWSPDYRTTERWSTPSLQNVHWSDLVDVVPLAAPAGSYTRTESPGSPEWWHKRWLEENGRAVKAEQERDEAVRVLQEALDSHDETLRDIASGKYTTEPSTLTADDFSVEAIDRAQDVVDDAPLNVRWVGGSGHIATHADPRQVAFDVITALTEPPRPAWADLADTLRAIDPAETLSIDDLAEAAHDHGVRVASVGLTPTNPEKEQS